MSRSIDFIKNILLTDSDGNRSKIINITSSKTPPQMEIFTQSSHERELKIATRHVIRTEEVLFPEDVFSDKVSPEDSSVLPEENNDWPFVETSVGEAYVSSSPIQFVKFKR